MKTKLFLPLLTILAITAYSCSSSKKEDVVAPVTEVKEKIEKVVEKVVETDYRKGLSAERIAVTDKYRQMRLDNMKENGAENLTEMAKGKISTSVEGLKKDHLTPEIQQSMEYFCATRKDTDALKDQGKCQDFLNNSLKICKENNADLNSDAFKECVKSRLAI